MTVAGTPGTQRGAKVLCMPLGDIRARIFVAADDAQALRDGKRTRTLFATRDTLGDQAAHDVGLAPSFLLAQATQSGFQIGRETNHQGHPFEPYSLYEYILPPRNPA